MRIIFAGTPATAVPPLQSLIDSSHDVVAVITRPPARAGRGRTLVPSPVAQLAHDTGIPVIEARNMRDPEIVGAIGAYEADLGVVVAYGALIPQAVLDVLPRGWVNLHYSDLPRWRGAAPVQRAIMAGDSSTASCIFQLEAGLDTGPVFSRLPFAIGPDDTTDTLLETMSVAGGRQIVDLLDAMVAGSARSIAQDTGENGERVTLAPMLHPADGLVTFTQTATATDCHIRAYTSNPGAWTVLSDGKRLKLGPATQASGEDLARCGLSSEAIPLPGTVHVAKNDVFVACSDAWLRLGKVAPAGKGWMDAAAWARGARLADNDRLGGVDDTTDNASAGVDAGKDH